MLSVVIVGHERPAELGRLLDVVLATPQAEPLELIVVDHGGLDDARASYEGRVAAWLGGGRNQSAGAGRNLGTARASSNIVVFLDDDGVPAPGFLQAITRPLLDDDAVWAVRGRIRPLHHRWLTTAAPHYDLGDAPIVARFDIEGASAVRKHVFESVGGFAEVTGHEGLELETRVRDAHPHLHVRYAPDAVLHHDYLTGIGHLFRKARRMRQANAREEHRALPKPPPDAKDPRTPAERLVGWGIRRTFRLLAR